MDPSRLDEGEELLQKHAKESTVSGGLLTIHNSSNLPIKITVSEEDPDAAVHKNPAQLLAPIQRTSADSQEISSPQSSSRYAFGVMRDLVADQNPHSGHFPRPSEISFERSRIN